METTEWSNFLVLTPGESFHATMGELEAFFQKEFHIDWMGVFLLEIGRQVLAPRYPDRLFADEIGPGQWNHYEGGIFAEGRKWSGRLKLPSLDCGTLFGVHIVEENQKIGLIWARVERPLTESESTRILEALRQICRQAQPLFVHFRAREGNKQAVLLKALLHKGQGLTALESIESIFETIAKWVHETFQTWWVSVLAVDRNNHVKFRASAGSHPGILKVRKIGLTQKVLRQGRA